MKSCIIPLVCILLVACDTSRDSAPTAAHTEDSFRIEVSRVGPRDWRLSYQLTEPVRALRFPRNINLFRADRWTATTPGVTVRAEDDFEVIRTEDGSPFQIAEFSFSTFEEVLQKDYEFNLSFTDGGVLLYTGHLNVEPFPERTASPLPVELVFRPQPGERVIMGGQVSDGAFATEGTSAAFNTYVYFGSADPIRTPELTAIIDPGLPTWIKESTDEMLPRLFEYYTTRTAVPMTEPPLVFFSYREGRPRSYSYGGGTLPGPVAQLAVTGQGWQIEDRDPRGAFGSLLKLLAHESAHLWNSQLVDNQGDPSAAWMHEGGADAFAFQVLRNLDLIDDEVLWEWRAESLNACKDGLAELSVHDSAEARQHGNYYTCGSTLALFTEFALRQENPELDLFDFWSDLLRRALDAEVPYDESRYFNLLNEYSPGAQHADRLRAFIYQTHSDPSQALADLFETVGVKLGRDDPAGDLSFPEG